MIAFGAAAHDRVGVVGVGVIGSAVVERLVRGWTVSVWDPSPDAMGRAVGAGAVAVDRLSGLVDTPVVLMALPGPD